MGLNETEAKEKGIAYDVSTYGIDDLDRAIADSEAHGLVKVLTAPGTDKILGATIAGEHAGDLIVEFVTAMRHGIGLNKILGTIHIYPTLCRGEQVRRRRLEALDGDAGPDGVRHGVPRLDARRRRGSARCSARSPRAARQAPVLRRGREPRGRLMARLVVALALLAASQPRRWRSTTRHKAWDDLLKKHVRYVQDGNASRVAYAGFAKDRAALKAVLDEYQKVDARRVRRLDQAAAAGLPHQRLQRVHGREDPHALSRHQVDPRLRHGVRQPVEGQVLHALRRSPRTSTRSSTRSCARKACTTSPRVHVAVVCASIGCPMLRNEAFVAGPARGAARGRDAPLPVGPHAQPLQPADRASSRSRGSSTGTARTSRRATRATPR